MKEKKINWSNVSFAAVVGFLCVLCIAQGIRNRFVDTYDTVADLVQKAGNAYDVVHVLGYYTPGDGGGGMFVMTNTVSSTNLGTRIYSARLNKSWERIRSPRAVTMAWFGADPNNTLDSTAAFQAAADSMPYDAANVYSTRGGVITCNGGKFRTTSRVTFKAGTALIGDAQEATIIIPEHINDDVFYCETADGSSSTRIQNWIFKNITIAQKTGTTPTNGAAIHVRPTTQTGTNPASTASRVEMENVYIYGTFIGANLYAIQGGYIRHCTFNGCRTEGVLVDGYATMLDISSSWSSGNGTSGSGNGWRLKGMAYCSGKGNGGDSNKNYAWYIEDSPEQTCKANNFQGGAEKNDSGQVYLKNQNGGVFSFFTTSDTGAVTEDAFTVDGGSAVTLLGCYVDIASSNTGYPLKILNPPAVPTLAVSVVGGFWGTFGAGANTILNSSNGIVNTDASATLGRMGIGIRGFPQRTLDVALDEGIAGTASKVISRITKFSTNNGGSLRQEYSPDGGNTVFYDEWNSGLAGSFGLSSTFTDWLRVSPYTGSGGAFGAQKFFSGSVLQFKIGNGTERGTTYFFDSGGVEAAHTDSTGLVIPTAGKGIAIKEGSNAKMGTATLVAGTVTVSTTAVTANSRIFLENQTLGGTAGFLRVSARTAGTSFAITSSNAADTSTIAWMIVEPAP